MEILTAFLVGICLSAATGFRVFIPLLVMSIAAHLGAFNPAPGFAWIASDVALVGFATATIVEVLAYLIPWLDNVFDIFATPLAIAAGVVVMAAVLGPDTPPLIRWSVAAVAGGGISAIIQLLTVAARKVVTVVTAGCGNFLVSLLEFIGSILVSILALVAPLAALALLVLLIYRLVRSLDRRRVPSEA